MNSKANKKHICIDVTNIVPGVGGAGGGIATYAKNLVIGLDHLLEELHGDLQLSILGHPEFLRNLPLRQVKKVYRKVNNQSLFSRFFWLNFHLPNFLKENQVDLLHRVIPELPFRSPCKNVVTLHDFMFDFYLRNRTLSNYLGLKEKAKFLLLRGSMRATLKSKNMILVPSDSIAKELKIRFSKRKLQIQVTKLATQMIPKKAGIGNHKLEKRGESKEIKIGYIAGYYPHKGHKKAVQLMKLLLNQNRGKNIHLFFRGSVVYPEYFLEVKDLVEKEGLKKHVFFEEFESAITVQEIYQKYDVTLLLSEYEGFGLPVLESQTYKKPVLCSDIPVFRENLQDSAFFIPQQIREAEVEKLLNVLHDNEYLEFLSETGVKNSSKYSWQETCQLTLSSYLKLLNS